jgi:hypothetical protein
MNKRVRERINHGMDAIVWTQDSRENETGVQCHLAWALSLVKGKRHEKTLL